MDKEELYRINTKYCERYFDTVRELATDRTFKKAWITIESERSEIGLPERYQSYTSFRKAFMHNTHETFNQAKKKRASRS